MPEGVFVKIGKFGEGVFGESNRRSLFNDLAQQFVDMWFAHGNRVPHFDVIEKSLGHAKTTT